MNNRKPLILKREKMVPSIWYIYDGRLGLFFKTIQGMAAPLVNEAIHATVYREPQARAICDNYYGKNQWPHVQIRQSTEYELRMWAAHLGGVATSAKKKKAVVANAKKPRGRWTRGHYATLQRKNEANDNRLRAASHGAIPHDIGDGLVRQPGQPEA